MWISRINAAARDNGTTYSKLMHNLKDKGVDINRKVLANLALENPQAFSDIVNFTKE
ncbi:MAG: 50S ribosomal protein L20 [Melioribacteraceae bacterium]|nr:50S ribosomal protein L20 [Melioribacteraceae bacterium]